VIVKLKQVRAGMLHDLLSYGLDENGQLRDPIAHPEQFKNSPLGRIPKEWEVSRIEDVSEKVQDGTHFSPKSNKGPRRYLTSKNIRLGYIDLSDCGWISENEHHAIFRRCDVRRGDVLLTKDGANTGNAAINILDDDFSLLSSVAFIRGKKGRLISEYLLNYLISPVAQKRIKDLMSGNAITRLTLQKIKDFTIPVPEPIEQQMIAEYFNECAKAISEYEAELESYKNIKFGLQDDLLTGRVRVPETIISIDNG
jgi:type I restriction enzyme S subunit